MSTLCPPCPFLGSSGEVASPDDVTTVTTEIAGVVIDLLVAQGDRVWAGDAVAVLESMKMEIPVISESGGIVQCMPANLGEFLQVGGCVAVLA